MSHKSRFSYKILSTLFNIISTLFLTYYIPLYPVYTLYWKIIKELKNLRFYNIFIISGSVQCIVHTNISFHIFSYFFFPNFQKGSWSRFTIFGFMKMNLSKNYYFMLIGAREFQLGVKILLFFLKFRFH